MLSRVVGQVWKEEEIAITMVQFQFWPKILGTDNGCQTSLERFTDSHRKAFFGKCVVVIKGKGTLKACCRRYVNINIIIRRTVPD